MLLKLVLSYAAVAVLVGSAAAPGSAAVTPAAATKCAIPQPCSTFTNSSSGPGIEAVGSSGEAGLGVSSGGAGLIGLSGSGSFLDAGVDGESYDASGNDAGGVFGADFFANGVAPTYGAVGVGAPYGLLGFGALTGTSSSHSYGVIGQDNYGTASGGGDYNVGVAGQSTVGTGVLGTANGNPTNSLFGSSPIGVLAVADTATGTPNANAFAFFGETNSFGIDLHDTANGAAAFVLTPSYFLYGSGTAGNVEIYTNGSEALSGSLTTSKGTYVRTTGASGTTMMEYSQRTTAPQVDDVGEAQLVNGRAYVNIDARLGDTIDRRAAYHVFVTPEGDCKGLFVTQKSATGFAVRELQAGRSSLAFEYRIVAKPLDENGTRLAIAPALAKPPDDGMRAGRDARRTIAPPSSPLDRLKRQIGTQTFAEKMLEFRARRQSLTR